MRSTLFVAALALAGAAPLSAQGAAPMDSLELGRKATEWFYNGTLDSLWAHQADTTGWESRSKFDEEWKNRLYELAQRAGFEEEMLEEEFVKRNGQTQYWRTAKFNLMPNEPIMVRWVIVNGRLAGFGLNLARNPPARD